MIPDQKLTDNFDTKVLNCEKSILKPQNPGVIDNNNKNSPFKQQTHDETKKETKLEFNKIEKKMRIRF